MLREFLHMNADPWVGPIVRLVLALLAIIVALAVALAFALMSGCTVGPLPPPGDSGAGDCASAAANLEALQCVSGQTCSLAGDCDDFEERCTELETDLPGILNTGCLARAGSCAAADRCAEGVE